MKIYRGKQKIGKINEKVNLLIDFNDLFYFKGQRLLIRLFTRIIGSITLLISGISLAVSLVVFFNDQNSIDNLVDENLTSIDLLITISIFLICYSLFLLRDKNKFGERFEIRNMFEISKYIDRKNDLEVENFFIDEVIGLIEDIYKRYSSEFIYFLSLEILEDKRVLKLLNKRLNLDTPKLVQSLKAGLNNTSFDASYKHLFLKLFENAMLLKAEHIDLEVLFMTLATEYWKNLLFEQDISDLEINSLFKWIETDKRRRRYERTWLILSKLKPVGAINRAYTSKATPTIDQFGIDYTAEIIRNGFELSLGKDIELEEAIRILRKDTDPNVLIVGEPGVGKTFLLKHLASMMVVEDVPIELQDMRLVVLDLNRILAQTTSFNDFENTMIRVINEVITSNNIITVFENIDYLFQIREEGRLEILNLFKSYIQNSDFKVIATSNTENYYKYIKQDYEFSSLFDLVEIKEATPEVTTQIVLEKIPELEKEHKLEIQVNAVNRVVKSGIQIQHEKVMPDKALDLLEEVILYSNSNNLRKIDSNIVDEVFTNKFGAKLGDIDSKERVILKDLELIMHERVVGQDQAVKAVSTALRRSRAGLKDKNRPIASFLFFGPTGVGKTLIAKTLADMYYGHENKMIRLNMSEFHEERNVGRLIGELDEKGNFVGGFLSEKVRSQPFSLVLLDEIEKANKKVLDLFLQVLDEGYLTDGSGRDIDFRNTIIIATSNAGSKEISEMVSIGEAYRTMEMKAISFLNNTFRIEFLNRFDKLIMFKSLNVQEVEKIIVLELNKVNEKLSEKGITISWDEHTVKELVKIGFSPIFGAREIRRAVTESIEDKISDLLISTDLKKGQTISFKGLEISDIV